VLVGQLQGAVDLKGASNAAVHKAFLIVSTHVSHPSNTAAMKAGAGQDPSMLWPLVVIRYASWVCCCDLDMQHGRQCTLLHWMPAASAVCGVLFHLGTGVR
jgi:hypothetical protein